LGYVGFKKKEKKREVGARAPLPLIEFISYRKKKG